MRTAFAALMSIFVLTTTARADEGRTPLAAIPAQYSSVPLDSYHASTEIVRVRSPHRRQAVFTAAARELDWQTVLVFEARSEGKDGALPRWRCVARHDVSECLGDPLTIRYLPGDERVVLKVTVVPRAELPPPAALAALAER